MTTAPRDSEADRRAQRRWAVLFCGGGLLLGGSCGRGVDASVDLVGASQGNAGAATRGLGGGGASKGGAFTELSGNAGQERNSQTAGDDTAGGASGFDDRALGDRGNDGSGSGSGTFGTDGSVDKGAGGDGAGSTHGATGGRNAERGGAAGGGGKIDAGGAVETVDASASDRCDVAIYDPASPPASFTLSGDLGTHDPALLEAGDTFYLFHTGSRIPTKTSTDLRAWKAGSPVFASNPSWIATMVPGTADLWAPDISYFGEQYHLYYAASTFGSNTSCIGHATRRSLTSGSWTDEGSVICSSHSDDWNAIDPQAFVDIDGSVWLDFGSFWSGIKMIRLAADGTRADSRLLSLANRPNNGGALEGPYLVRRCGYYYLFTSWDKCCDGLNSDYNLRVVRATTVTGPYVDKDGIAATQGGGTLLTRGNGTWIAPGHNAVVFHGNKGYNVYHALASSNATPTLRVSEIAWDAAGWPVSAGP